jgi:Zn-dependent M28 family amino/carboxypeptidase
MIATLLLAAAAAAASPISADRIKEHDRILSSDAFGGRGPGEPGEERTIAYLAKAFTEAGLEPGGDNGTWFQDVPLVRLDRAPGATMALTLGQDKKSLVLGKDATLSLRNAGHTSIIDAPLVFAGFGIVDPAKGWDSYRGIDMTGKVAILLANDPDFEGGKDLGFEGRRLVLSGRVGSKYEAAMKAGAIAALVIHEDATASYPFLQVGSGDAVPAMVVAPLGSSSLKASGWLSKAVSVELLKQAGLDLKTLKRQARDPNFKPFALTGQTLSLQGDLTARTVMSHNVIAKLTGATRPNEYVLYGAHWDANGTNGPDASGDAIRNGAIDNATGTSELLEVARAFTKGKRPARTMIFAAWTAEEKGLIGADFYAGHALYPLARTAAAINLDPHLVLPAARTIELIGGGRTPLEKDFARIAATQHLKVVPEPSPEAGWYFRSDHYPFARRGVPTVAFRIGRDLIDGGYAAGSKIVDVYNRDCYHQPCDQFDPRWTFAGAAQEANVAFLFGSEIANQTGWPGWNAGGEFEAARKASASERAAK